MTDPWAAARELQQWLEAGRPLPTIDVPDAPLADGEVAHADVLCTVARYYATEVHYPLGQRLYFEEHPVLGRRLREDLVPTPGEFQAAQRAAEPQWRDSSAARVVLSSSALHLQHGCAGGPWSNFAHSHLAGFRPDANGNYISMNHPPHDPVLLGGPHVPWLTAALIHLLNRGIGDFEGRS
ncbi:hypothetical protein [Streptomyces sp. NPDC048172]|uniref:hypothetical protein n=1 Tax=Streptomyces sp. NPDC048172 TaxID=3365505 RepID=UPI003724781A